MTLSSALSSAFPASAAARTSHPAVGSVRSTPDLTRGMGLQLRLQTVLCDLDDCLYRVPEMPELVRENIQSQYYVSAATQSLTRLSPRLLTFPFEGYMREQLGVPQDEVTTLCLSAYTNFGTTMAGLVVGLFAD